MKTQIDEIKSELTRHIEDKRELSASEVADYLRELKRQDEEGYTEFLRKLDDEKLGEVAIELPEHMLKDVLQALPSEKIAGAIDELDSDDATDLLQNIEEIDEEKAGEIFLTLMRRVKRRSQSSLITKKTRRARLCRLSFSPPALARVCKRR